MKYRIEMTSAAHRRFKKFDKALQERVKDEALVIAQDPFAYKQLQPPFQGIYSYRFNFRGVAYRIAYWIDPEEQCITIVLVHKRESFYKLLRRALGL